MHLRQDAAVPLAAPRAHQVPLTTVSQVQVAGQERQVDSGAALIPQSQPQPAVTLTVTLSVEVAALQPQQVSQ